jgi:glycosyltransferase involved in cell wall biosynthesis
MVVETNIVYSVIVPTLGRRIEVSELLASIKAAEISVPYEVLIIDQNPKGFLDETLEGFLHQLPIVVFNVDFKGLSKAKNFGVSKAKGQIVSFPDDDCRVFKDTFAIGLQTLNRGHDLVFGRCIDELGNDTVLNFKKEPLQLDIKNMLGGFVEATVFCKKEVLDEFKFDDNMGAGTFFGAEEGYDWLYRILVTQRKSAFYNPDIKFYHPHVIPNKGDTAALKRVFSYRCGTAYLCRKHQFFGKYFKRLILVFLAGIGYSVVSRKKSIYYKVEYHALRVGWLFSKNVL